MRLKGILSYYDLISYLISPKKSAHRGERIGNKISFYHLRVKNFSKSCVLTLTPDHFVLDALRLILEKEIGSVVIIDKENKPIGIITTKDILRLLLKKKVKGKVELVSESVSQENQKILNIFFDKFSSLFRNDQQINRAKLMVKQENVNGLFKVILSIFPKKGQPEIIKKQGKDLVGLLKKIKKQLNISSDRFE